MGFQCLKHRSYKQTYNLKMYTFKKFHSSPAIYSQNTPIPSLHFLTDKKYEKNLLFHIPSLEIVSFLYKIRDFSRKTPLSFLMLDMQLFGDKKNSFCFKRHKKHWKNQQSHFLQLYPTYKGNFGRLKLRKIPHSKLRARSNSGILFKKHFLLYRH